jgi:hypothetical protein
MEASNLEVRLSRVYQIQDEIQLGKEIDPEGWRGYDKRAYNRATRNLLDEATDHLCGLLRCKTPEEIEEYSLETQMWWRDHQIEDRKREELGGDSTMQKLMTEEQQEVYFEQAYTLIGEETPHRNHLKKFEEEMKAARELLAENKFLRARLQRIYEILRA